MAVAKKAAPAKKAASTKKIAPSKKALPAKKVARVKKATPVKKAAPAKKTAPAKKPVPAKSVLAKKAAAKRTPNAAFLKALTPTKQLSAVLGSSGAVLPTNALVGLFGYIKSNQLLAPGKSDRVSLDSKLKAVVQEGNKGGKSTGGNPGPSISFAKLVSSALKNLK